MKNYVSIKKIILIQSLFFWGFMSFASSTADAVMRSLSTSKLADNAEIVAKGSVTDIKSFWAKDKNSIVSWASIKVTEIIKGTFTGNTLTVEFKGGEVDGVGFRVSDAAKFFQDENVLLFLKSGKSKKDDSAIFNLIGRSQGKYTINVDGTCVKSGFAVVEGAEAIDNNLKCDELIKKIK
jgi:hypothetical protein